MKKTVLKSPPPKPLKFVRKTVTIPGELSQFVNGQAARPEHSGNLSSYLRSLILRDRQLNLATTESSN